MLKFKQLKHPFLGRTFRRYFVSSVITYRKMESSQQIRQPEWHIPQSSGSQPKLKVYNSLTRSKTDFIPMKGNMVTWYSCGPTVYDASHMGHARNYVSTDINRRIIQDYFGYNVLFVQNVTDIDDKIILRARQNYLFEQFASKFEQITDEVVSTVKGAVIEYGRKHLSYVSNEDLDELTNWINSLNVVEKAVEDPKFPMHSNAIKSGILAVNTYKSISKEKFFELSKHVLLVSLDKELGATVTDPGIFRDLAAYWEKDFDKDMAELNVLPPSVTTRVSEYVPEIIEFIQKIISNGFGYMAEDDGSIYFDTISFDKTHDYAKLQPWNKGKLELIEEGEGSLSIKNNGKRSKNDFALWKASKPGEPAWDSPWGKGRPGWHIECSVMASDVLGPQIDIHTGGIDLAFPHHDNELAQSEACHGCKQWVNYFLHTGHLHIEGQKMSKSLKNFITIKEALTTYTARQLRLAFAMQQWNYQLDFKSSLSEVKAFETSMNNFFNIVRALLREQEDKTESNKKISSKELSLIDSLNETRDAVHNAFCDNLSTPVALDSIYDLVQKSNQYISGQKADVKVEVLAEITRWITKILSILGFDVNNDGVGWSSATSSTNTGESTEGIAMPYIKVLSKFRDDIRNKAIAKAPYQDFLASTDRVRNFDLLELGVSLDDRPDGQSALIKFVNSQEKAELIQQRDEKVQREQLKLAKKAEQAKLEETKRVERLTKAKIPPNEMFKKSLEYREFDEEGIPTVDKDGELVSKSSRKKLVKLYEAQKKLHQDYLSNNL